MGTCSTPFPITFSEREFICQSLNILVSVCVLNCLFQTITLPQRVIPAAICLGTALNACSERDASASLRNIAHTVVELTFLAFSAAFWNPDR